MTTDDRTHGLDPGDGSPLDILNPDDIERVNDGDSVLYWEIENPHEWIYAKHPAPVTQ